MIMPVFIYALINPIHNNVFYIGATISPKERLSAHIYDCGVTNKPKHEIIKSILLSGLKPEMEILDKCDASKVIFWEEFYIQLFTTYGYDLKQTKKSNYKSKCITSTLSIDLNYNLIEALNIASEKIGIPVSKILDYLIRERIKQMIDDPMFNSISEQLLNKLYPAYN